MQIKIDPEFKALIPQLAADEYELLEASIKAEGCRDALVVWGDILIDGHNRYEICQKHSVQFQTTAREFDSREDVVIWMVNNQLARRNITSFVRGELALRMKSAIADKAKANQLANLKQGKEVPVLQSLAERVNTRAEVAKAADMSQETIRKVEKVAEAAPEQIKESARRGDISVDRAYRLTKVIEDAPTVVVDTVLRYAADEPEKADILKRLHLSGLTGETNGTFDEISQTGGFSYGDDMSEHVNFETAPVEEIRRGLDSIVKHHRRIGIETRRAAAAETPPPTGKYKCIVIDPPWPVEKIERDVRPNQGQQLDYPTMTLEQIKALPISDLAYEDGCHLYLWTTHKFLPDAFELVKAWGFHYQCLMTWVKPTGMTPYSWMYNTEHVLFARRGSLDLSKLGMKLAFEAPVTVHSAKPDVFYERVLAASIEPRIEMFARKEREGFYAWGNEIGRAA